MMTKEQHANSLASYLPNGKLFKAKNINDSNFRQLLRGLAGEVFTSQGYLRTLEEEYIPDATNLFLSEWEQALGIPDDCFDGKGTNDERRTDILVKLASSGIQTDTDFEELALKFGVTVVVTQGILFSSSFPVDLGFVIFQTAKQARFTIVVDFTVPAANQFTLTYPIPFGSGDIAILECLFSHLKPANCDIVFRQV